MTDAGASELDVEVLLNVVDEDVDDGIEVPEGECKGCGDFIIAAPPAVASHAADVASQMAEVEAVVDNDVEEDVET